MKNFGLFSIFVLFSVGNYIPIIGLLALRISTLLVLGWMLIVKEEKLPKIGAAANLLFLAAVWLIWGIALTIASNSPTESIRELVSLSLGLLLSITVYLLLKNRNSNLQSIVMAWLISVYIACGIGFWEVLSGQHLSSSYSDNLPSYAFNANWAMSTFGNPNNFSAFLLLSSIFLLHGLSNVRSRYLRFICAIGLIQSFYFVIIASSRLPLAGLVVVSLFHFLMNSKQKIVRSLLICSIFFSSTILAPEGVFSYISSLSSSIKELGFTNLGTDGSALERRAQTFNGIEMIVRTYGAGVGPANFFGTATSSDMPYRVVTPNPHNFFIEIASQYGLLVLILFVALFSRIVWPGVSLVLRNPSTAPELAKLLSLGAISYPIACLANSSFIAQPVNWLFIGTLLGLNFRLLKNRTEL